MIPCSRRAATASSFTILVSLAFASSRFFRPAQAFLVFRPASSPLNLLVAAATPTGPGKEGSNASPQPAFIRSLFTDVEERRKKEQASISENVQANAAERLQEAKMRGEINVLGGPLELCGTDPMTGFTREGCCTTGPMDLGSHTVCAVVTEDFLRYSKSRGNDLMTPRPDFSFPGLKSGDKWCLCASRWAEAYDEGVACSVLLKSTHIKALDVCDLSALIEHALDPPASHTKDAAGGGKEGGGGGGGGGKEEGGKELPPRKQEEL